MSQTAPDSQLSTCVQGKGHRRVHAHMWPAVASQGGRVYLQMMHANAYRKEGDADDDVQEVVGDGTAGAAAEAQVFIAKLLLLLLREGQRST